MLHLSIFFRKASDEEARPWLAKKHMIAWGIINELGLKIEQLDDEVATDQHCIAELQQAMKLEEANHGSLLESVINEKTEQIK